MDLRSILRVNGALLIAGLEASPTPAVIDAVNKRAGQNYWTENRRCAPDCFHCDELRFEKNDRHRPLFHNDLRRVSARVGTSAVTTR